jgi:aminopeptidase N
MRKAIFIFSVLFIIFCFDSFALKSDTIHVKRYSINLSIVHLSNKQIKGFTELTIVSRINSLQVIKLDLLQLNIDSIMLNDSKTTNYTYNDSLIKINLTTSLNQGDSVKVKVFYRGIPQIDPSTWGGFYFSSDSSFAYNLGVGFDSDPHVYGRCWFPCVDEFVDRSFYECKITVENNKAVVCGGTLMNKTNNGNGTTTYQWKLRDSIPTYLVSVAVGNYSVVTDTFSSVTGKIPILLYVRPVDTTNARNSFINLKTILSIFESKYGPYKWERVGYAGVPFNSGAMEHATNIAYPNFCVDGTLNYESLYTHELSHHWFGDLITCTTAEDMWINEGWARFSEYIYNQYLYGYNAYKNETRQNHMEVLQYAHIEDGAYRAVYGIPTEYTYGTTVYDKGSNVAYTLRGYIGDSLFFSTIKSLMHDYAFKNISTSEFRDYFTAHTGVNMNDFFDAWVYSPGFPHFSIDSFSVVAGTPNNVTVHVRQRSNHMPTLANSNKIEVQFIKNNWLKITDTIKFSGQYGSQTFQLPFVPDAVIIDPEEKVADATTDLYRTIKSTGAIDFPNTYFSIDVTSINDSAFIRAEHNWVPPDAIKTPNADIKRLSNYRYWKIDGIFPASFISKGKFRYNRTQSLSGGYLDNVLMKTIYSKDSLLLLYRRDCKDDWKTTKFTIVGNQFNGNIIIDSLKKGEYTLAIGKPQNSSVNDNNRDGGYFNVFPNPSGDKFTFEFNNDKASEIKIYNSLGQQVDMIKIGHNQNIINWTPVNINYGTYYVCLYSVNNSLMSKKQIVYTN